MTAATGEVMDLTRILTGESDDQPYHDESLDCDPAVVGLRESISRLGESLATSAGVACLFSRLSLEDQAAFFIQDEILASRGTLAGVLESFRRLSTAEQEAFMDALLADAGSLNGTADV
jgi:hypothetical protein